MKISIEPNGTWKKDNKAYLFGVGNDHAYQLHRRDMFEHIREVHEKIGFRYIRFHGIFDDDMLTIQSISDFKAMSGLPYAHSIRETNFRQIGDVFQNVLDAGFRPFVELSFMPSALAKKKKTGLRYQNNTSMPKDLGKWEEYLTRFFEFLIRMFGKEEVKNWYFEVWNEPDLSGFFNGSKKDYFRLYEVTARTVKKVYPEFRVGGPSTSACKWIKEFRDYIKEHHVPCDFISTHHYPGDAFGNMITFKTAMKMISISCKNHKNKVDMGDTLSEFFFHPEIAKTWGRDGFKKMDAEALKEAGDLPLFITEWNSMAVFGAPVHDEKYSSAFVIKSCMDLNPGIAGTMFWCASDIFEEQFMLPKPFVGSFGMISNDGIPKPNFQAFRILTGLYPERLVLPETEEETEYAVFRDEKGNLQVLFYAQSFDYGKKEIHDIDLEIKSLFKEASVIRIDDTHCNPKKMWEEMGKPDNLTKEETSFIKAKSNLQKEKISMECAADSTFLHLQLKTNDVVLLKLEK